MLHGMGRRLLHYRFTFALAGAAALCAGAWLGMAWLAVAGVAAAAIAELAGVVQARVRFPEPLSRLLRGGAEALPAIGVAAFEPFALGLAVVIVLYAVMAAGMETVSSARGVTLGYIRGETTRRVLTAFCSLSLLAIPALAVAGQPVRGLLATGPRSFAALLTGVVLLACLRGLLDIALEIRRVGRRSAGPNVDS